MDLLLWACLSPNLVLAVKSDLAVAFAYSSRGIIYFPFRVESGMFHNGRPDGQVSIFPVSGGGTESTARLEMHIAVGFQRVVP